jgi:hypothetical protein
MLVTTSWVEKVKDLIGLEAVSQVWGDKPAWYFWISQAPGVYYLQLEEVFDEYWESDDLAVGIFSIKCYPYTHEKVFQSFSFEEQSFIQSHFFDHTHTPLFEHKENIPKTLFNVATLELTMDSKDNIALFTFEGLDSMRICYNQEILQTYAEIKKEKKFEAGEKDRDVPGYKLGYLLFDRLLSLYSFYSKIKPERVLLSRSPGFEYIYDSTNRFQCVDTDEIRIDTLHVLFAKNGSSKMVNGDKLLAERLNEGRHEVVFDQQFQCGHLHHNQKLSVLTTPLNNQWWSLADSDYKSELASSCGCTHDHH